MAAMEYQLLRDDVRGSVVAKCDELESELAATTWARNWLENHADHDRYRLAAADCGRPILMVRTVAGQWYAIPVAAEAGKA